MIEFVADKIKDLSFENKGSVEQLDKLANIAIFCIHDSFRSALSKEVIDALQEIVKAINADRANMSFSEIFEAEKNRIMNALNPLTQFLIKNRLDEPSIFDKLKGEGYTNKMNEFNFYLLMVEQNNWDYFKDRPSSNGLHPSDRLHSHWIAYEKNGINIFDFLKESDLPQYIRDEVIDALNQWKVKFDK